MHKHGMSRIRFGIVALTSAAFVATLALPAYAPAKQHHHGWNCPSTTRQFWTCAYAVKTSQGSDNGLFVYAHSFGVPNITLSCSDGTRNTVGSPSNFRLQGRSFSYDSGVDPQTGDYWRYGGQFSHDGKRVSGQQSMQQTYGGANGNVTCTGAETFNGHKATYNQVALWGFPYLPPHVWCDVPNLKGRKLNVAKKALKKANCRLGKVKQGKGGKNATVRKQKPKAGTILPVGSKVKVILR